MKTDFEYDSKKNRVDAAMRYIRVLIEQFMEKHNDYPKILKEDKQND